MGNFTTNTAIRLVIGQERTQVRYILDLAEIPTVQTRQRIDADGDGDVSDDEAEAFGQGRCDELADGLDLAIGAGGGDLSLSPTSVEFPEGQAGLATTRLVCDGVTDGITDSVTVTIDDGNGLDRVGWREITAVGDEVTLDDAAVPALSTTQLLRSYPDAAVASPLRVTSAEFTARPGGPAAEPDAIDPFDGGSGFGVGEDVLAVEAGFFERITTRYTDLIAEREVTPGFIALAVLLAIVLGATHAVAPGHGKTVMAAYVVGERGSTRQALAIGGTVALTHTVGTLLLGVAIRASETLAPEGLYPYFGLVSGLLIVGIGVGLVRSALGARTRGEHGHDHDDHDHGDHDHEHTHEDELAMAEPGSVIRHHGHTHVIPDASMSWRRLIALGVAGGLAPSPSALLVLLAAISIGRTALGVGLVTAYGLGLALVLVGGGLLLVRFREVGERLLARQGDPGRFATVTRWLPVVTGAVVILGGIVVAVRGFLLG